MAEDSVDIRVRLREAAEFERDAHRSARAVDEIGDQAAQAARRLRSMNSSAAATRLSLGPFSTSMRGGALAVGGLVIATEKFTPAVVGAAEAVATLVGGAGAAGAVGLIALGQGAGVARLGLGGLMEALGGSEDAARGLSSEAYDLFRQLQDAQDTLRQTAEGGLIPGLTQGAQEASRQLPIVNQLVGDTAQMLGMLGRDAGAMVGTDGWGRDLQQMGVTNVRIIDDLGHAGLNLADAARHVLVEAGPLTEWLAQSALSGSVAASVWAQNARNSGEMADFFHEARVNLSLLASVGGHGGRGIINLFGAQDVDGTRTLRSLDQIMGRFERWTDSPAVRNGLGDAIVAEIPDAAGAAAEILAHGIVKAAPKAAGLFIDSFMEADAWGKLLMGGWLAKKLGVFGLAGKLAAGGVAGGLTGGGVAGLSRKTPVPVFVTNPGFGGPGVTPTGTPGKRPLPRIIRGAGRVLPPVAAAVALGELAQPILPHHDYPTRGMPAARRAADGAVGFTHDPFQRVPDVNVTTNVSVDGERIAVAESRATSRRNARRPAPQINRPDF